MYLGDEMSKSLVVITPRYYPLTGTVDLNRPSDIGYCHR